MPGWKFKDWAAAQKFKYDLVVVNNDTDTEIGVQRKIELLSGLKSHKEATRIRAFVAINASCEDAKIPNPHQSERGLDC